jgi:hypothetical protein
MDTREIREALKMSMNVKIRASFFILMQNCTELKSYGADYFSEIRDLVYAVAAEPEDRPALTEERETIKNALRKLYSLKVYFNLSKEWTWQNYLYHQAAESPTEPAKGQALFYTHLENMTKGNKKKEIETQNLCEWMSCIPLRMTAARYHDYVADAVRELSFDAGLAHTDDFKRLFNPMDYLRDAEWLSEIKNILDEKWAREDTTGEYEAEFFKDMNEKLVKITAYISTLFDGLCAADIALKARSRGIDLVKEAEELHRMYINTVSSAEKDESFHARLDKAIDEALGAIKSQDSFNELDASSLDEETRALYDEWLFADELFYENSFNYFTYLPGLESSNSEGDTAAFLKELKEYMDDSVRGMNGKRKRFLRQHFLNYLPYPYDLEVYRKYFLDTYDSLDEASRQVLSFMVFFASGDWEEPVEE